MANRVVSGAYEGRGIIMPRQTPMISLSFTDTMDLNSETIKEYEVIGASQKRSGSIGRAAVGAALLGPVGLLAGATGHKNIYQISVTFKTGARSLLEVDDKIYRAFVAAMYR